MNAFPPTLAAIAAALADRPPVLLADPELARAAVALVLSGDDDAAAFLLVERVQFPSDPWSGHLALPGGRRRPEDVGLRATAERETREEVGLDLAKAAFLGRHDDFHGTVQPIAVATFVYHAPAPWPATPGEEIARATWCPLRRLYEPARQATVPITWRDRPLALPAVRVLDTPGAPLLWGLTYRLIETLLLRAGSPLPAASPVRDTGDAGDAS